MTLTRLVGFAAAAIFTYGIHAGCSGPGPDLDGAQHRGDEGGTAGSGPGAGGETGTGGQTSGENHALGVVVIDVQETFVRYAKTPDMAGILSRIGNTFALADGHELPFLITYEASKTGDHALYTPLIEQMPTDAHEFITTTFAATGLPSFRDAVSASGVTHVALLGAETDACVLQTALGLRDMGLAVLLQSDAVFTSETNTPPALRRMQQAGVVLIDEAELASYAASPQSMPMPAGDPPTLVAPLEMGVVLHHFTEAHLSTVVDPLESEKGARLRELLLISDWFERPVYVEDVSAGLPNAYSSYYSGQLLPLSQLGQDSSVTQLVFAGTDGGLSTTITSWLNSRALFVMEDALLTTESAAAQRQMLAPLEALGLVPTTYKSFYYDMTQTVDEGEWPSQSWVDKFDEFYWITQSPEDLPPIYP